MYWLIGIAVVVVVLIVIGVVMDKKKENELKERAAGGDAQAQYDLARRWENNKPSEAAKLFGQAAEQGHVTSQVVLGLIYKEGKGIGKDPTKAVHWFKKAAEQNCADAQYELGLCCQSGEGIQKAPEVAVEWFEKAASQNHAEAQYELGVCYLRGDGVAKDMDKAIDWCKKANENGSGNAKVIIGFKEIDDVKSRPYQEAYQVIKECCIELVKSGYNIKYGGCRINEPIDVYCKEHKRSEGLVWSTKIGTYNATTIPVYNGNGVAMGNIEVRTNNVVNGLANMLSKGEHKKIRIERYVCDYLIDEHLAYMEMKGDVHHLIQLDGASILIKSKVPSTEPPPEWLKICAKVLAKNYTICNPDWVREHPHAERYVNSAFQ